MEKLEWLCVSNFSNPWNILKFSKVKKCKQKHLEMRQSEEL